MAEADGSAVQLDANTAIQAVLKKAASFNGVVRGLRESAKALERKRGKICILADDCSEAAYVKLVEALCAESQTPLYRVDKNKTIGEWVGLCKITTEGEAKKVIKCSCAVIVDWGVDSAEKKWLEADAKSKSA
jgi:small subunit ribosomal protein S12e